jgi:hypothetical protein
MIVETIGCAIFNTAIKPSSHQAIKPSSHQAIKPSSHQAIKPPSHQATMQLRIPIDVHSYYCVYFYELYMYLRDVLVHK